MKNKQKWRTLIGAVPMAQSAANWCNAHTHVERTHSLTHLHQHSNNHVVRSTCSAITEFGIKFVFWRYLRVPMIYDVDSTQQPPSICASLFVVPTTAPKKPGTTITHKKTGTTAPKKQEQPPHQKNRNNHRTKKTLVHIVIDLHRQNTNKILMFLSDITFNTMPR